MRKSWKLVRRADTSDDLFFGEMVLRTDSDIVLFKARKIIGWNQIVSTSFRKNEDYEAGGILTRDGNLPRIGNFEIRIRLDSRFAIVWSVTKELKEKILNAPVG